MAYDNYKQVLYSDDLKMLDDIGLSEQQRVSDIGDWKIIERNFNNAKRCSDNGTVVYGDQPWTDVKYALPVFHNAPKGMQGNVELQAVITHERDPNLFHYSYSANSPSMPNTLTSWGHTDTSYRITLTFRYRGHVIQYKNQVSVRFIRAIDRIKAKVESEAEYLAKLCGMRAAVDLMYGRDDRSSGLGLGVNITNNRLQGTTPEARVGMVRFVDLTLARAARLEVENLRLALDPETPGRTMTVKIPVGEDMTNTYVGEML